MGGAPSDPITSHPISSPCIRPVPLLYQILTPLSSPSSLQTAFNHGITFYSVDISLLATAEQSGMHSQTSRRKASTMFRQRDLAPLPSFLAKRTEGIERAWSGWAFGGDEQNPP